MEDKKGYERLLEAEIKRMEAEFEVLVAKAEKAKAEAKLEQHRQIEELKKKMEFAREKLQEVTHSAGDAWKEVKAGAEAAVAELSSAFKRAMDKFK